MPRIKLREFDNFDIAARKLKRLSEKAGVFTESRRREYCIPPTEDRKRAKAAARKRTLKQLMRTTPQTARRTMRVVVRKKDDARS